MLEFYLTFSSNFPYPDIGFLLPCICSSPLPPTKPFPANDLMSFMRWGSVLVETLQVSKSVQVGLEYEVCRLKPVCYWNLAFVSRGSLLKFYNFNSKKPINSNKPNVLNVYNLWILFVDTHNLYIFCHLKNISHLTKLFNRRY